MAFSTFRNQSNSFNIFLAFLFILGAWSSQLALSRSLPQQTMLERHEQWMAYHGRTYKDAEEKQKRYTIFKDNVERIEAFNQGTDRKYELGVNKFSDLTDEEFRAFYNGFKNESSRTTSVSETTSFKFADGMTDVPSSLDWREKGAVTAIKNQGQCGCCWAFSAVAAIEGIIQLKTGNLISLSEQQLLDCTTENNGCNGGWMDTAFRYIQQNQGITTEENYPYESSQSTCRASTAAESNYAATITGYEDVPANSEQDLLKAVANQPVSVTIDGSGFDFKQYKSGVFTGGDCSTRPTHAVTMVGYGVEEDGTKYWLVKNSWGVEWGESGYMKLQRDVDSPEGLCGIAKYASYPTA